MLEIRVEGGRPRKTWLDNVEVDMAELEIDREDIHDRRKWKHNVLRMNSNPIRKRIINH